MNKIIVFLWLFITFILVSFCVGGYTHDVYEIDITKKLIYNSGVGNEWHIEFICDNQTIGKTHKIAIPIGEEKKVTINTVITEKDKYPDIGRGSFEVAVKEGEEVSTNILIRETRGRNSGAKAKWEVKCNVNM